MMVGRSGWPTPVGDRLSARGRNRGGREMAKSTFDTSFDFGANVKKKAGEGGSRKGKRKLSAAQKATAVYYMQPRRRR
jgi:hypothetical protein